MTVTESRTESLEEKGGVGLFGQTFNRLWVELLMVVIAGLDGRLLTPF